MMPIMMMEKRVVRNLVALAVGVAVAGPSLTLAQTRPTPRSTPDRQQRYQTAVMERVLEGAVEHGAALTRDRLQAFLPADMLLSASAHARGFRLEGYGMFFDVAVPSLEGAVPWTFRALDQSDLGVDSALRTLRSFIEASSRGDINVDQALKRLELQVAPIAAAVRASTPGPSARVVGTGVPSEPVAAPISDSILENPQEAYRAEIQDTLMNAMLEHSRSLGIGATEWLTVAARRSDDRPRLSPVETDTTTIVIRASGGDLAAFLGGQLSREEARKRMEVRVF
jgi:hypothetical protein